MSRPEVDKKKKPVVVKKKKKVVEDQGYQEIDKFVKSNSYLKKGF